MGRCQMGGCQVVSCLSEGRGFREGAELLLRVFLGRILGLKAKYLQQNIQG